MSVEQEVKDKAAQMQQLEARVKELENVGRICGNAINLINDMEMKGAYAKPVGEVIDWLGGIKTTVQSQIDQFKTLLPKPEVAEVVDVAEVK